MAGLLENYYEFFENEEEDFSSTNDLSSITEQVRIFWMAICYHLTVIHVYVYRDLLKCSFFSMT